MLLSNQLVIASEYFAGEGNLSPNVIPTQSKVRDEQLKLAHKVVDVVDRLNKRICVTQLQYSADNPECSYAQVRLFPKKKEDENFQQIVFVNSKLENFFGLLDVMKSVYDKIIANKPFFNVL